MTSLACAFEGCNKPAKHRGYCEACYSRLRKSGELPLLPKPTLEQKIFSRITEAKSGCWLWTGTRVGTGYGQLDIAGRKRPAHRVVYEFLIGEIPGGLDLDHLCRVRHCVNPWHLEPVTRQVNIIRGDKPGINAGKTHCPHGHEYTDENTIVYKGSRFCRACKRERQREYQQKKREAVNAVPLDAPG
ncbi:HNH endonuclease signature motif containing protein [Streptomyces sp. NPDC046859]|uniref:HNH endonuclease signature motif containing protein n=1 Tax=Streptomyces sp. NPDC046859 TaxID=3155734 RepID=UPI00340C494A